jgi:hypothetical protein
VAGGSVLMGCSLLSVSPRGSPWPGVPGWPGARVPPSGHMSITTYSRYLPISDNQLQYNQIDLLAHLQQQKVSHYHRSAIFLLRFFSKSTPYAKNSSKINM